MDNQCDRCGRELSTITRQVRGWNNETTTITSSVGFHLVIGGNNIIDPDGETDWDPEDEYDLCLQCKEEFLKLWQGWYREEKGGK